LVVLASLLVPLATTAVWARRTVVNTNEFEDTVGPLARDRAVQIALTNRLTAQIMTAVNVKELFAQALPERGQFLAGPLTNAIEGFVHEKVDTIVSSEQFARLWEEATRRAQIGMLAVLRDESKTVRTENGRVVLNLVPVINTVLASINKTSPEVLGRDVTLYPGTMLQGATVVGDGCEIGPDTRVVDSRIGDGAVVEHAVVRESTVGARSHVGPYAVLEPGTVLRSDTVTGAFYTGTGRRAEARE